MKNLIIISLLIACQALGNIGLSHGMGQIGEVNSLNPAVLLDIALHILMNPWIWMGVGFLIIALFVYLVALSWLDLSYLLPMTASNYVLNAVLAWLILGENISVVRWVGTLIVSVGVSVVSIGEHPEVSKEIFSKIRNKLKNLFFFLLPISFSVSKTWFAVMVMVLSDSIGDILLSKGMKQVGEVEFKRSPELIKLVRRAIINPYLGLGVFCMAIAFFMFISLLSWSDLSFVMPMTALGYVVSVLGAGYFLQEKVSSGRLFGTMFICIGVALISASEGMR